MKQSVWEGSQVIERMEGALGGSLKGRLAGGQRPSVAPEKIHQSPYPHKLSAWVMYPKSLRKEKRDNRSFPGILSIACPEGRNSQVNSQKRVPFFRDTATPSPATATNQNTMRPIATLLTAGLICTIFPLSARPD